MSISTSVILGLSALFSALQAGNSAIGGDQRDLTDGEARDAIRKFEALYANELANNDFWIKATESEKINFVRQYITGDSVYGDENVNYAALARDLGEYDNIEVSPDRNKYRSYTDILDDAQASVDAENQRLLDSLNEDLANTSEAYVDARNQLLSSDHMQRQQIVGTMASDMSRARHNAIEAGASAGVRIASNVNAILSAQNKMSQQSLETSNQLAQMLVNQRNAESGLRSQWRDVQANTFDKTQNRANAMYSAENAKYDDDYARWQSRFDDSVSSSNKLANAMSHYKNKSARSAYSTGGQ